MLAWTSSSGIPVQAYRMDMVAGDGGGDVGRRWRRRQGLRRQRVVGGLFLRLWTSLRPCRSSSSSPPCTFGWCLRSCSLNLQYAAVTCTHSANCQKKKPLRSHKCCSWVKRARCCASTGSWSRLCRKLCCSRSCSTLTRWSMCLLRFLGMSSSRTRLLTWPLLCRQRPGRDSAEKCRGSAVGHARCARPGSRRAETAILLRFLWRLEGFMAVLSLFFGR